MPELRWVEGPDGAANLINESGDLLGTVTPLLNGGRRAQTIRGPADDLGSWLDGETADHPTEAAARTWVEDAVRRGETGGSGVEGED